MEDVWTHFLSRVASSQFILVAVTVLLAQNTFLDNVMKRAAQFPDSTFLIGNAQIIDFPIVYVSDEFCRLVGYRKVDSSSDQAVHCNACVQGDIMLKPLCCDMLSGPLTEQSSLDLLRTVFEHQRASVHEILYYKKNGSAVWLEVGGHHYSLS